MLTIYAFKEHIRTARLFTESDRLLLAVSGGVDSMVLCELCAQSGYLFEIAHANFQLRGISSDEDEKLVRTMATRYRVPVHVRAFNTSEYAQSTKVSVQVAARQLRYQWFGELLSGGFQWLLTAHHAGDNVETLLMNFFRGTGIRGLHGIPPKQQNIIRPLLPFTKQEILQFADEQHLEWREDASNSTDKYTRNYFRNTIIPMVAKVYPETEGNLIQNIARFKEAEELYDQAITSHKKSLLEVKGTEVHIPVLKLKKARPLATIIYEIIKEYNFSSAQVTDVIALLDAEQGKYVHSATHRVIKNRKWLIIAGNNTEASGHIIIEEGDTAIVFPKGILNTTITTKDKQKIPSDSHTAYINLREITFPLVLRKWKTGDYFYPLGMPKKKKVARFLIDEKVSPTVKQQTWIVESANRICWIVGMRIDHRFRVQDSTQKMLCIQLEPA